MPPISTDKFQISLRKTLDLSLIEKGVETWVWRASIMLSFKTKDGWSKPYESIIDTGAPVSILPPAIWKKLETKEICHHQISGIVPDAALNVQVAEITSIFMDSTHQSNPITFKAFLSDKSGIPLIIGFDGILAKSILHLDSAKNQGYLEFSPK